MFVVQLKRELYFTSLLYLCRFGANAQLLHSFDQPFSAVNGGHVLEHLSFTQNKTNFVEVLTIVCTFSYSKSRAVRLTQSFYNSTVATDGTCPVCQVIDLEKEPIIFHHQSTPPDFVRWKRCFC